jgi:lysophospholipase L1-like esterase
MKQDPTQSGTNGRPHTPLSAAILLVGVGLLSAMLLAEVILRATKPLGFRVRGNSVVLPVNESYVIEDPGITGLEGLDTRIVHRKNSLGFRGPEVPADYAERLSIIAVGGSTTECFYISDGRTWPDLLVDRLDGNFRGLWLNNAGLDGHSTWGHALLVRNFIGPLHPNVVLLLVGVNDMFAAGPNHYDRAAAAGSWSAWADHSEVVSTILNLVRSRQTAKITALGTIPKPRDLRVSPQRRIDARELQALLDESRPDLQAYRERLEELIALLKSAGTMPVMITQPSLLGPVTDDFNGVDLGAIAVDMWERRLNGNAVWVLLEEYNDVTRAVAREHAVPLVDLARAMPKSHRYYYDFFHFNNDGSREVAVIIYRDLCPILAAHFPERLMEHCVE